MAAHEFSQPAHKRLMLPKLTGIAISGIVASSYVVAVQQTSLSLRISHTFLRYRTLIFNLYFSFGKSVTSVHRVLESSPSKFCRVRASSYMSSSSYKDYVEALCPRNPSLLTLHGFLSNPRARCNDSRLAALDFRRGTTDPISREPIDVDDLHHELHCKVESNHKEDHKYVDSPLQGRILVIEDPTVNVVELLGSQLDIDPLFLALHIHVTHRTGMQHPTPDDATLPSRLLSKDFINISYHRPVICDERDLSKGKFVRDTIIDRKLVFLRSTAIGLMHHRVSVIKVQCRNGFWLGKCCTPIPCPVHTSNMKSAVMLVDPSLADSYFISGHKGSQDYRVQLNLRPFLGNYEDFAEVPKFTEDWRSLNKYARGGMLDDVIEYWKQGVPACFNPENPTIQSLAYYTLRIVAVEWVKYTSVMQACIKQFEYQSNQLPDLSKFSMDLHELQS